MKAPAGKTRTSAGERGAVMLEFAVTSMLFLTLVVVTMESAVAGFRALTAQYVASTAVRRAIIGDLTLNQVKNHTLSLANGYGLPLQLANIQVCSFADLDPDGACRVQSLGGSKDYLVVRLTTNTPFFLGSMNIQLIGEAAARNERKL